MKTPKPKWTMRVSGWFSWWQWDDKRTGWTYYSYKTKPPKTLPFYMLYSRTQMDARTCELLVDDGKISVRKAKRG